MTASYERILAVDIELAVRAIPGVSTLFRAGTLTANMLDAGARLVGIRDDSEPYVRVEQAPDGLRVEVAIGVHERSGAVDTIRHVQAAVSAVVAEHQHASAEVRITVVHITGT